MASLPHPRIILGIDPGLQHTGWGVVRMEGNRLTYVASGTIHTKTADATATRLAALCAGLQQVLGNFSPTDAAVEEVVVNVNARSSLKLGQARGVCLLIPAQAGLNVGEYTPTKVKKALVGTGGAGKEQVAHMVKVLLPQATPDTADAADALAVAICHAHHLLTVRA